jgi:hypothetical protein
MRCQQINNKMWEKAKGTLNLAESTDYTNVRGKKYMGTNSTYVCYGHREDPLGNNDRPLLNVAQHVG